MPQLDINTFIYQYVGIIFVFISVYILLSYVVLPITLRLLTFRAKFLNLRQVVADSLSSANPLYKGVLLLSTPCVTVLYRQFNFLLTRVLNLSNMVLAVLTNNLAPQVVPRVATPYSVVFTFTTSDFYLMLLLANYEFNEE